MALTDEQIDALTKEHWFFMYVAPELMRNAARAIETAACAERDARIAELERQLAEARNQALEDAARLCDRLQEVPATEARHCAADIRDMKEQT